MSYLCSFVLAALVAGCTTQTERALGAKPSGSETYLIQARLALGKRAVFALRDSKFSPLTTGRLVRALRDRGTAIIQADDSLLELDPCGAIRSRIPFDELTGRVRAADYLPDRRLAVAIVDLYSVFVYASGSWYRLMSKEALSLRSERTLVGNPKLRVLIEPTGSHFLVNLPSDTETTGGSAEDPLPDLFRVSLTGTQVRRIGRGMPLAWASDDQVLVHSIWKAGSNGWFDAIRVVPLSGGKSTAIGEGTFACASGDNILLLSFASGKDRITTVTRDGKAISKLEFARDPDVGAIEAIAAL